MAERTVVVRETRVRFSAFAFKKMVNILFMCRVNCFRSKVAEAYFNKINKNPKVKIKSAGIVSGYKQSENEIETAKGFGIDIRGTSQGISADLIQWGDILIIVADDVPSKIFDYEKRKGYLKKLVCWEIRDVKTSKDIKGIKRAIKQVMKKVDKLNKTLEKEK